MTEQRKHKQRIGLLGNPAHLNINPQQPAWWTETGNSVCVINPDAALKDEVFIGLLC